MRILQVTRESAAERRYGLGKSLAGVCDALAAAGSEVGYFCKADLSPDQSARLERWQQRCFHWPLTGRGTALCQAFVEHVFMGHAARLRAVRGAWGHLHFHDSFIALGYLLSARAPMRRPFGVTHHGFTASSAAIHRYLAPLPAWQQRMLNRIERHVLLRAHWLITPTLAGMRRLAGDLGLAHIPEHWHVLPHPKPDWPMPSRDEARQKLGWNAEAIHVLAVGQLIPLKGMDLVAAACARSRHADRIRLTILGEGDPTPILTAAEGLRHPPTILPTDEVFLYLAAADVYMSGSETESFGLANLEAMVAQVPSICTAVGAVPEVMGDAALLVERDVGAMTAALDALIEQPDLQAELKNRCIRRSRDWPDARATARKLLEIYAASPAGSAPRRRKA